MTVTDASGCQDVDSVTINISDPQVNLANDTTFCGSGSLTLDAGAGFASYLWNTGATSQTLATSGAGDYHVTVTDLHGCQDVDTTTITISNPVVDLGTDTTYCGTGSDTLDAGAFTAYLWNTGATTREIVITTGGTYAVTVTDASGCQDVDSVTINISDPQVNLGADTSICGTISQSIDAGAGFASYLWSTGATSQTIIASNAGAYSVTVTDLFGCVDTDTLNISAASTTVDLGPDQLVCQGASVTLDAGIPGATYNWSTGASTQTIVVSATGTYRVDVSNGGCVGVDSVLVTVNPLPVITFDPGFSTNYTDSDGSIALTFASPSGGVYSGPGVSASLFNTAVAGVGSHEILYTITDGNGCVNTDTLILNVSQITATVSVSEENLSVQPNPFRSQIKVIRTGNDFVQYNVIDAMGALVCSGTLGQATDINTVEWAAGTYYLQVVNETDIETMIIVKTK